MVAVHVSAARHVAVAQQFPRRTPPAPCPDGCSSTAYTDWTSAALSQHLRHSQHARVIACWRGRASGRRSRRCATDFSNETREACGSMESVVHPSSTPASRASAADCARPRERGDSTKSPQAAPCNACSTSPQRHHDPRGPRAANRFGNLDGIQRPPDEAKRRAKKARSPRFPSAPSTTGDCCPGVGSHYEQRQERGEQHAILW